MTALEESCDVCIVGAGISGLAAARMLRQIQVQETNADKQRGELKIIILEATDRVGGRTCVDSDGTDLGGAYIGPTQDRIMKVVDTVGLKIQKVPTDGKTVQYSGGKISHFYGTIPPLSIFGLLDLNGAMVAIDKHLEGIDLIHPMKSKHAEYWDNMTVEEFLNKTCWTESARGMMRTGVRVILACETAEVSMLSWLWYVKQSGGIRRIVETKDGAQDCKVFGGTGQIAQKMASAPDYNVSNCIKFNAPVRKIDYSSGDFVLLSGHEPQEQQGGGGGKKPNGPLKLFTIKAQYVILACAPVQQLRMEFQPALEPQRFASLQRWPMGHIIKTFTYYKTPFWKEKDLNGSIVGDAGIVNVAFDDTKPDGSMPGIMGFVTSNQAALWVEKTPQERLQAISAHYAKVFQNSEGNNPIHYKEKIWAEEQWVGGCYVGLNAPKVLTKYQMAHRRTIQDRIFMAGTEAAYRMVGYMDGAVESGERSARNVMVKLGRLPESEFEKISVYPPSAQMPFVNMDVGALEKWLPSVPTAVIGLGLVLGGVGYLVNKWRKK